MWSVTARKGCGWGGGSSRIEEVKNDNGAVLLVYVYQRESKVRKEILDCQKRRWRPTDAKCVALSANRAASFKRRRQIEAHAYISISNISWAVRLGL